MHIYTHTHTPKRRGTHRGKETERRACIAQLAEEEKRGETSWQMLGACGVEPFKARSLDARRRHGPPRVALAPTRLSSSLLTPLPSTSDTLRTDEPRAPHQPPRNLIYLFYSTLQRRSSPFLTRIKGVEFETVICFQLLILPVCFFPLLLLSFFFSLFELGICLGRGVGSRIGFWTRGGTCRGKEVSRIREGLTLRSMFSLFFILINSPNYLDKLNLSLFWINTCTFVEVKEISLNLTYFVSMILFIDQLLSYAMR